MTNCKDYLEQLEQAQATNMLLLEMVKNQKELAKNNVKTFIVVIVCFTLILISMIVGFFVYESQFETEYSTETITATIREVSGESSEINNVQGDTYNDSAAHNE